MLSSVINIPCLTEINKVRVLINDEAQEVSIKDVQVDNMVETPYGFRRVIGNFKHFDYCYKLLTVDGEVEYFVVSKDNIESKTPEDVK